MADQLLQAQSDKSRTSSEQESTNLEQERSLNLSLYSLDGPYAGRGLKPNPTAAQAEDSGGEIGLSPGQRTGQRPENSEPLEKAVSFLEKHRDDMWLVMSGASYHFQRDPKHNERNWGLGLEIKLDNDKSIVFGQYRNSIDNESHYGGITWLPYHMGPVSMGGMFGIIDGYRPLHGKPIPMIMPFATIEGKSLGLNIMAMPPIGDLSAVIGAQLKYKF